MHFAVVHDRINDSDAPDALDVRHQAQAVEKALAALGHTCLRLDCGLDLGSVRHRIEASGARMVVNLVESIEGNGQLIHLFPSLLDTMGLSYTGAGSEAMLLTSNKLLAKQWMSAAGIPTPPWVTLAGRAGSGHPSRADWIVKSIWEHASIGLDENSVVKNAGPDDLRRILASRSQTSGHPGRPAAFAETFIDGREFNLSVLAGKNGPEVLSPAEIIFEGFPPEMPKIVDYRAKWDETAYTYHHTPRTFDFASGDLPLLAALKQLTLDCWKCFGLTGYARVDFRVDDGGTPWVLEINANPCLSPDAGFAAALEQAGISFESAMERIIEDAV